MPTPVARARGSRVEEVTYGYVPWSRSSKEPCAPSRSTRLPAPSACVISLPVSAISGTRRSLMASTLSATRSGSSVSPPPSRASRSRAARRDDQLPCRAPDSAGPPHAHRRARPCLRRPDQCRDRSCQSAPSPRRASFIWSSFLWYSRSNARAAHAEAAVDFDAARDEAVQSPRRTARGRARRRCRARHRLPPCRMPDGIWWRMNSSPPTCDRVAGVRAALVATMSRRSAPERRQSCPCPRRPTARPRQPSNVRSRY